MVVMVKRGGKIKEQIISDEEDKKKKNDYTPYYELLEVSNMDGVSKNMMILRYNKRKKI